ncbi:hypothetical protein LRP60_10290 [Cutibacterium acnes]|nr:hypothetical protein [Cutibacterium acnes]
MSELVPPKQAAKLQNALLDYLTTTFALSDADAQRALDEFLRDPDEGIFKGPYLRTRMPFAPAPRYSADELEWMPENFTPYGHQARAFTRNTGDHRGGVGMSVDLHHAVHDEHCDRYPSPPQRSHRR